MWNRINLRTRIYTILTVLILITLAGGLVMVWYTYQMRSLFTYVIEKNVAAFQAAEELEDFKKIKIEQIKQAKERSQNQAERLRIIAGTAVLAVFLLGALLAFVLTNQVLGPVRRLALKAEGEGAPIKPVNEVKALSRGVHDLIDDRDQSRNELEKSQKVLLQAEKMALVGKLAAGTAHSIRNPLTSVKMRLFSLARSIDLNEPQKEDFDVISSEIAHIDTIVENFLEFSRPPKLKMQRICPSDVVDWATKLLRHRLKSHNVNIKLERQDPIPDIQADPEQFKEALLNILLNACEAMRKGGTIVIHEETGFSELFGKTVFIRLSDNGPGIPESILDEIFQPFFTTKEEGTGLGLSIAARIIEQHGGLLELTSKEGEGTTFIISLPVKESNVEQNPDN